MPDPAITLVLLLVAFTFLVMVISLWRSCMQYMAYRRYLSGRVEDIRIHKMLDWMGISTKRYLDKARLNEVETQLFRCRFCGDLHRCDELLDQHTADDPERFCPNYEELKEYRRKSLFS